MAQVAGCSDDEACSAGFAVCESETPAPTSRRAVVEFVKRSAIPLACEESGDIVTDELERAFEDQRVFMFGEVHGTNELGILSDVLFERLVRTGGVDVLALEVPVEFGAALQQFVDDGDQRVEGYLQSLPPNLFVTRLTQTARKLALEGYAIKVAGIDAPVLISTPADRIRELARDVPNPERILEGLPEQLEEEHPARYTSRYLDSAIAYHDRMMAEMDDICATLNETQCDELRTMTRAIWVVAARDTKQEQYSEWLRVREEVIYFNYREHLADPDARAYAHMGLSHVTKDSEKVGSKLANDFDFTRGRVVSFAGAWGSDSKIRRDDQIHELDALPPVVGGALEDRSKSLFLVSTQAPDSDCMANPLQTFTEEFSTLWAFEGVPLGKLFDGFVYVRRLTPEDAPDESTVTLRSGHPDHWQLDALWREAQRTRRIEQEVHGTPGLRLRVPRTGRLE